MWRTLPALHVSSVSSSSSTSSAAVWIRTLIQDRLSHWAFIMSYVPSLPFVWARTLSQEVVSSGPICLSVSWTQGSVQILLVVSGFLCTFMLTTVLRDENWAESPQDLLCPSPWSLCSSSVVHGDDRESAWVIKPLRDQSNPDYWSSLQAKDYLHYYLSNAVWINRLVFGL